MEENGKSKHKDIDGGYAWIILFSSFMCIGLGTGFRQIFGILYIEILDIYQAGKYLTSWIITLQVFCWGVSGKCILPVHHCSVYVMVHNIFTPRFRKSYIKYSGIRVFS